jgi:hypothetical protein
MSNSFTLPISSVRSGKRSCLVEQQDAVAKDHQGWNGAYACHATELLLGLGVNLAEANLGVVFGCFFEDRAKHLAWATPLCPEINKCDSVLGNCGFEILERELHCGHV